MLACPRNWSALQEIEIKPFIIHPSSFILFTKLGSTLSNDQLPNKRFDFQFINPPYGYEWSKDYDVRWQWSGATWTTTGCPQDERGGVHQFGVLPKGNANFARVQHFIHHLAPHGMSGLV